jgi:hypothetical protein
MRGRYIVITAVVGLVLIVALAIAVSKFWPALLPDAHGRRLSVTYSGVQSFGTDDKLLKQASYSDSAGALVAALTSALGPPTSARVIKDNPDVPVTDYRWKGLNAYSYKLRGVTSSEISVDTSSVDGVPIYALNKYKVGGPFPGWGAMGPCALTVYPFTAEGIWDAFNPPRINAIESPHKNGVVAIFEDDHNHGVVSGFSAPRFAEGC